MKLRKSLLLQRRGPIDVEIVLRRGMIGIQRLGKLEELLWVDGRS
jgi:hypothetical protein